MILAHGSMLTGDLAATSLGIIAFYGFWKWLSRPTAGRAAAAGVLLGLAELSKYVWVIMIPLWPLIWVAWRWMDRDRAQRPSFAREAGQGLLIYVVALFVINLGFAFESPFQPLGSYRTGQTLLRLVGNSGATGQGVGRAGAAGLLASLPVPLPENYVRGIDAVGGQRALRSLTYLWGELRAGGWWYYYPCALAMKMPLGTLALLGLACILIDPRRSDPLVWRTELLLLIVPFLVVLCFVTWSGTVQRPRYVMPILALAFLWAGSLGRVFREESRLLPTLVTGCLAWAAVSSLWIYPHNLSYFNELVGGPKRGHEHLNGANIDWGQGLLYLKGWYDRHPEARPFHLAYFGTVDPRLAGIEFSLPPSARRTFSTATDGATGRVGPQPGWHAVSTMLFTVNVRLAKDGRGDRERVGAGDYGYFLAFRPEAMAGYSIFIYHVDRDEANRVRRQLGLPILEHEGTAP